MNSEFRRVYQKFIDILGDENVHFETSILSEYERATFDHGTKISGIVLPATKREVAACLKVCVDEGIKLAPISAGRNWGYGSKLPYEDGCIIMDLARMNNIIEINEKSAYTVIEPGVTFEKLHLALKSEVGGRLWLDAPGSSMHSSVIGNILERGHGLTPYADHVAFSCNYEVVLSDGRQINTSFAALDDCKLANLDNYGLGPALEGLFSQSNFGVVTRMTIWLMPAPEATSIGTFSIESIEDFKRSFDLLGKLRLEGFLRSGPHFGNIYLSLARSMTFPWHRTGGQVPLPYKTALQIGKELGLGRWNGLVTLYGYKEEVDAKKKIMERMLKSLKLILKWKDADLADVSLRAEQNAFIQQVSGGRGGTGLYRANWRTKDRLPSELLAIDWDRDSSGVIAIPISLPVDGDLAASVADIVEKGCLDSGFEPQQAFFNVKARTVQSHSFIIFDRTKDNECELAKKCARKIMTQLRQSGLAPHRNSVLFENPLLTVGSDYSSILSGLKNLFDPKKVISPGRYLPDLT